MSDATPVLAGHNDVQIKFLRNLNAKGSERVHGLPANTGRMSMPIGHTGASGGSVNRANRSVHQSQRKSSAALGARRGRKYWFVRIEDDDPFYILVSFF